MKIISVINQKGGSGKTSFSVLCCLALAQKGFKVLAVDCDPQGGMSGFLRPGGKARITDLLLGSQTTYMIDSNHENIEIISSDYQLDKMYVTVDHLAFKRALAHMFGDYELYDYIIFDTPPTMQGITRAAIHVSDKIFVPCELSKSALNPTLYTLDCLAELEKEGEVVFIDKEDSKHKENIRGLFIDSMFNKMNVGKMQTIRRDIPSQKIISGECRLTDDKIKKYLDPVYRILEG